MHEPAIVLDVPLIPHHQPTEVAQPGKQALELPAPVGPPQHSAM